MPTPEFHRKQAYSNTFVWKGNYGPRPWLGGAQVQRGKGVPGVLLQQSGQQSGYHPDNSNWRGEPEHLLQGSWNQASNC